jgi:hypothetical protein
MYATKETFVFNVAAAAGGLFFLLALEKFKGSSTAFLKQVPRSHWFIALGGFLVTGILFFTSFFTHRAGPLDSILTYLPGLPEPAENPRTSGPGITTWSAISGFLKIRARSSRSFPTHTRSLWSLGRLQRPLFSGHPASLSLPERLHSAFGRHLLRYPLQNPWCFIVVIQGWFFWPA